MYLTGYLFSTKLIDTPVWEMTKSFTHNKMRQDSQTYVLKCSNISWSNLK